MANRFVECDPTNDGRGRWVDEGQLVRGLDRHDYTLRTCVVLRVSRLATELDLRDHSVGPCIDYKVAPPDSSETNTRRSAGAYAIPSGKRGPGTRATIRSVESS